MPHAALDIRFHSNPKILTAGNAAVGLYARALSYCADNLTDGFVTDAWARCAGTTAETRRLVDGGLFVEIEGGYSIPDYLDFNFSKQKVKELIEQKREAGKASGKARRKQRDVEQKPNEMFNEMLNRSPSETRTKGQPQSPVPLTLTHVVQKQFTADPEIKYEIERILPLLRDVDEGTGGVLAAAARDLPPFALAKVRESVTEHPGSVGPGYVVNALKSERAAIEAAAVEAAASLRQAEIDDDIPFASEAA